MSTDSTFNIAPESLELGAVLSRGSPGITLYKAELLLGQRTLQVAVKRLSTSGASPALEAAFLKEIHILQLASGTCGRACRMLGCCKLDKDPCIVMTLYPKSAAKLLEDNSGPVPMVEVINLAVEVLEGLAELHAANIWHLDLKPPNILLDLYGHAYLSDFGISYALRTLQACTVLTATAGTPHYMAPEQADADFGARGPHSDVWGFAATVLHLATGEQPYKNLTVVQMISAMVKSKPPSVSDTLPAWLQHLLKQCFSFNTASRPPVAQLLQAFKEQLTQGQDVAANVQVVGGQLYQQNGAGQADMGGHDTCDNEHDESDNDDDDYDADEQAHFATLLADLQSTDPHKQQDAAIKAWVLPCGAQQDAIIAASALPLLVALLRSDQPSVLRAAASSLGILAHRSKQRAQAVFKAGVVPPLVALLRSDQPNVPKEAAQALGNLADGSEQRTHAIIEAGAVPLLVARLRSKQPDLQQEADALAKVAYASEQGKNVIIATGAVPLLVALLRSAQDRVSMAKAARALRVLADGSQQAKDFIIAAGAVPRLVALSGSNNPKWQCPAADLLSSLAAGSQQNKGAIIAAGAVPVLIESLKPSVDDADYYDCQYIQRSAADVLGVLASGKQSKDTIIVAGAVPLLVALLKSDSWQLPKVGAAIALASLADGSQQSQDAIVEAGAVPLLVANLRSEEPDLQHTAANALGKLAAGSQESRDAIIAAGSVPLLFNLSRSDRSDVRKRAASALTLLARAL